MTQLKKPSNLEVWEATAWKQNNQLKVGFQDKRSFQWINNQIQSQFSSTKFFADPKNWFLGYFCTNSKKRVNADLFSCLFEAQSIYLLSKYYRCLLRKPTWQ